MRKNERERLKRRAAYQHAKAMAVPTKIELPFGMTVEEFDRLSDLSTAYHEAGHAVASWMQGLHASMRYVPKGELTNGHDLNAVTSHESIARFVTRPSEGALSVNRGIITDARGAHVGTINDGGVCARQQAFVTLAGPFAETYGREPSLPDSVYKAMFHEHAVEAQSRLLHFSGESPEALQSVYERLVTLASNVFELPAIQHCVKTLAERFHKARKLSEQEVRETIEAAWNEGTETKAAKAGE